MPKIRYNKKWFNPLFFIIEEIIEKIPSVDSFFIYGGKSSAKTVSVCQYIAKKGVSESRSAILLRKESTRVTTTIKRSFNLAIETTRLTEGWTKLERKFNSISGAEVILTGLDNEDKAKGVEGYDFILFDELDQFYQKEYESADLSMRGEGRKILFATWNPVNKNSWVKKKLTDKFHWLPTKYNLPGEKSFVKISSCGSKILIKTNYKDNFWTVGSPCGTYGFVDSKLIAKYELLKKSDYNSYKVNVLGEYGNINRGGEFYKSFNSNIHVKKVTYNDELPLHISFDENVNPYISLSIYQAIGQKVSKIDEICLEHPYNTLKHSLDKFKRKYPNTRQKVFIYGDRTSLKSDTKLEKGQNFFTIIEADLKASGYITQLRLPMKNPSVHLRGLFINEIFASNIYGIDFIIGENCSLTIDDYENVKEAPDGTKHKKKIRHPVTKISYEEYGHLSDTDDYFLCEYFKKEYNDHSKSRSTFRLGKSSHR